MNRVSGDSLPHGEGPNASIQTEGSVIQGPINEECSEESSRMQYRDLIGYRVKKQFGEETYEGSVEIYNDGTNTFQVLYENGHRDEIQGDDIVHYLELYRDNVAAEDAPLRASTQPLGGELPGGGSPIQNMATADANVEGNDGDIRKLSQAGKQKAQSPCSKHLKGGNAPQAAPAKQPSRGGIETEGKEYRALRMRAANAGDITKPCPSEKARPRTRSSGNKRRKRN